MAEKPTSSSTTYTTFGAPSGAFGGSNGVQSGTESRISMLIVPLNGSLISRLLAAGQRIAPGRHIGRPLWRPPDQADRTSSRPASPRPGDPRGRGGGPVRDRAWRSDGRLRANGAQSLGVDVVQGRALLSGVGPLAPDVAGEGQPPGEHGADTVAVTGQEEDVDEQPDPPADEAAHLQRPGRAAGL